MPDFQWSYRGATFGDGTLIEAASVEGFGLPDLRTADAARSGAHGSYVGADWSQGRSIIMQLEAFGATSTALEALLAPLFAAAVPSSTESPLAFKLPGQVDRFVNARCRRRSPVIDNAYALGFARFAIEFYASDPRIYATTLTSLSATLPTVSGGLAFPAAAPFVFGSSGSGGAIAATNSGTFETPWTATFNGPLVAPTLSHTGQGKTLAFTGTLAAGETLVLDSAAKTVLLNGTASRYSWLTAASQWFTIEPGSNPLAFAGASGTGSCTVTFRSAWI